MSVAGLGELALQVPLALLHRRYLVDHGLLVQATDCQSRVIQELTLPLQRLILQHGQVLLNGQLIEGALRASGSLERW